MIDAGEEGYGDLPSHISDVCKTSFVEVLDFNGDKIVYHLNGTEKTAFTYFKDLEVGDFVTIHVNRVVEKISEEDFREYSRK